MSFFEKLKQGMTKTRKNIAEKLSGVFSMFTRVDEDLLEELEETLILCDVGVNTATRVIGTLRERIKAEKIREVDGVKAAAQGDFAGTGAVFAGRGDLPAGDPRRRGERCGQDDLDR